MKKKSSDDKQVGVLIVLKESHQQRVNEVLKSLEREGFHLGENLDAILTLTGSVNQRALEALSAIEGVERVEIAEDDYRTQTHS
jgi:hypothetical protein